MPSWPWARRATDATAAEATVGAIYRSSTGSLVPNQRKPRCRQRFCSNRDHGVGAPATAPVTEDFIGISGTTGLGFSFAISQSEAF